MAVGTGRYFSTTSRSPLEKWRSAPTVRNPCRGKRVSAQLEVKMPFPAGHEGTGCPIPPHTAWLVTTSLVKSMPSGSGICTPFFVLSAERKS